MIARPPTDSSARTAYTGRARRRTTRRGVRIADALARACITVGGIGTIVCVCGVCCFLVWVVLPLFRSAETGIAADTRGAWAGSPPLHTALDEYRALIWTLLPDGESCVMRLDTGEVCARVALTGGRPIACASFGPQSALGALGFADGSVELARHGFTTSFMELDELPAGTRAALERAPRETPVGFEDGVLQLTSNGQVRRQRFEIALLGVEKLAAEPLTHIDCAPRPGGYLLGAIAGGPGGRALVLAAVEEAEDFLSGETTLRLGPPRAVPLDGPHEASPRFIGVSGGQDVYVAWEDGRLDRFRYRDGGECVLAERGGLTAPGATLTHAGFVLGLTTLVWGDSAGAVRAGFPVRSDGILAHGLADARRGAEDDHYAFAVAKQLAAGGAALSAMHVSARSRIVVCGFADGELRACSVTSAKTLASARVPCGAPVVAVAVAPKEDGFAALTADRVYHYTFDPMHPEATLAALFRPVWYEGYPAPMHMWQSSAGRDDAEPKFGLMPMVFGTLKATLYAMLFGAPLALLAAVYSSEFLHPRAKAVVKPALELMASLPSVVLGFLAALVLAPFVQGNLMGVLCLFGAIPSALLAGAYLWQLIPGDTARRWQRRRLAAMLLPLGAGIWAALSVGPLLERLLVAGDLEGWLSWSPGSGEERFRSPLGGWFLLALPACAMLAAGLSSRWRARLASGDRAAAALRDLAGLLGVGVAGAALAFAAAAAASLCGLDPRADWIVWSTDLSPIGTYVQRNALIVGFVMGFAIIPIIYTIADDALTAVPQHLRSASLGAGATPWQTAVRIVIPTAVSGLFSALMVGLGRAVGETMIVLMALGNTPVMEWNLFNGARTLSANIAVELPEAVRNSTHYRTLFLSALVLFVITFVINTVAETVRLRFRKRAYQL